MKPMEWVFVCLAAATAVLIWAILWSAHLWLPLL